MIQAATSDAAQPPKGLLSCELNWEEKLPPILAVLAHPSALHLLGGTTVALPIFCSRLQDNNPEPGMRVAVPASRWIGSHEVKDVLIN